MKQVLSRIEPCARLCSNAAMIALANNMQMCVLRFDMKVEVWKFAFYNTPDI